MQKVLLIGYLGRDPEVKYSQQGTVIAQFSVATTERWKDKDGELQEHTEWLRTESWDEKQTGGKHYRDLIYVDRIEFLDSKGENGTNKAAEGASDETTVTDEDVPF